MRSIAWAWGLSVRSGSHWNALVPRGLIVALLAIACSAVPPSPRLSGPSNRFSGEVAQAHAVSLAALGPRLPGSKADGLARRYLTREFRAAGATVRVAADAGLRHLLAEIAGDSPDALLLVAAYPDLERDEWIGDSGAALLLELARVLSQQRPRYTLQFALAETRPAVGDVYAGQGGQKRSGIWLPVDSPMKARSRIVAAGESLARALVAEGDLERLRGVLVFDAPARPGLRFARDLRSYPVYRDVFWQSASALGFDSTFPRCLLAERLGPRLRLDLSERWWLGLPAEPASRSQAAVGRPHSRARRRSLGPARARGAAGPACEFGLDLPERRPGHARSDWAHHAPSRPRRCICPATLEQRSADAAPSPRYSAMYLIFLRIFVEVSQETS